jgi:hypothetical protein
MGKKAKAHRAKVAARNVRISNQQKKLIKQLEARRAEHRELSIANMANKGLQNLDNTTIQQVLDPRSALIANLAANHLQNKGETTSSSLL